MKHLLAFLLCATIAFTAYPQNGGQAHENAALKIEYVGKIGTRYYVKITNKQNCWAWEKINLNGNTDDVLIAPNYYYLVNLGTNPPSAFTLKAKASTDCGCGDMGWVEFRFGSLPLKFKSIRFERNTVDKNKGTLYLEVTDVVNVKHVAIRAWLDVNTKVQIGLFWPDPLTPNTIYQYPINDIQALVKQLQGQTKK